MPPASHGDIAVHASRYKITGGGLKHNISFMARIYIRMSLYKMIFFFVVKISCLICLSLAIQNTLNVIKLLIKLTNLSK